jgi:cytoskeleton protein RodZ
MSSVGETLRRERLRKDLSLEQISRETKIRARLLDAIEREQFDMLPSGVFAKSFVRQYARFLGLDEEELAGEAEKAINPVTELPGFATPPPQPVFKVPRVGEWPGSGRSNSSMLPALALVVAMMLVCSAVYAWWQRSRRPSPPAEPLHTAQQVPATRPAAQNVAAPPAPKPAEPAPVTPAVAKEAGTPPKTDVTQRAPAPESAAPAEPKESANPAATLHVSLAADADTWVQAWADGKCVVVGTLQANAVRMVDAMDTVRIRTGNAGGLQVTVNGKPAGPLGPKGQIRIVEISRDKVQILLPPPKPAPAPAPEPL